jgi:hypothetical protein
MSFPLIVEDSGAARTHPFVLGFALCDRIGAIMGSVMCNAWG